MQSDLYLSVSHLTKKYPPSWRDRLKRKSFFTAVNNISFELNRGEIVGLLGPNGAGKTTTIQMLLGTLTPTSGSIAYFGKNFSKHRSKIIQHIGFASAYTSLPTRMTVLENLNFFGQLYGMSSAKRKEMSEIILKRFGIWDLRNKQTETLSAGQVTRTMLAKAFLHQPKVVLLDEPTASLDPDIAHEIRTFILEQQRSNNISILIASHNMDEVTDLCNRVLVIKAGQIIASDKPMQLAATIKTTQIQLMITDGLKRTIASAQSLGLPYHLEKRYIEISIDEHQIAEFLALLATQKIEYAQISIKKPTLEDYFIQMAKQSKV